LLYFSPIYELDLGSTYFLFKKIFVKHLILLLISFFKSSKMMYFTFKNSLNNLFIYLPLRASLAKWQEIKGINRRCEGMRNNFWAVACQKIIVFINTSRIFI